MYMFVNVLILKLQFKTVQIKTRARKSKCFMKHHLLAIC